jgi:hypothetical protein
MSQPTIQHQIGQFVVSFQHAEAALTELLVLMVNGDDEAIRILVNDLEYSKRVITTDVMFARFVDLRRTPDQAAKEEFHKLMISLLALGTKRNHIVHSQYTHWVNTQGASGLIQVNSTNRASKGSREAKEEELLPDAFAADFQSLSLALQTLERFRIKSYIGYIQNEFYGS